MPFLKLILKIIRHNPILSAIVILGFILRIIGTNPGYYAHGYEIMYGQAVLMILEHHIGLEYNNLAYPPLVAWIMAMFFLFFFIPISWVGYFASHLPQLIQGQNIFSGLDQIFVKEILGTRYWQNAMYWGRYITALFGTGAIILIYKIVMEFFNKKVMALIAALMVAINYRLVLNSHMGFHDMFNVFFILLTLYSSALLLKKPTLRFYVFASISAGLTFLIKYQTSGFVVFGLTHIIISAKNSNGNLRLFLKILFRKEIITAGLLTVTMLLIAHIDYFLRIHEVLSYSPWVWYANEFGKYQLYLFPFSYIYHTGLGEILTLLSLAGIVIGLIHKKYREPTLIMSSVIVTTFYLFAFFSSGGYYTYNLLIPIAVSLIFAALSLDYLKDQLINRFAKKIPKPLILIFFSMLLALSLKDHIINSITSTYILSQPSYFYSAQDWIDRNIKAPAVFGSYSSNPTPKKDGVKAVDLPKLEEGFGYQEFLQEKLDYALIDFYKIHEKLYWWMLEPPRIPTQFWNKPDDLLSQTYYVLATRELLWDYTIQPFFPKWQAAGYSYAVTKLRPKTEFGEIKIIEKFGFETRDEWIPLSFLEKDTDKLFWTPEGRNNKGSLFIKAGRKLEDNYWRIMPGSIRWESPEVNVKSGLGYKITGWIKPNAEVEKRHRNGFLRLDFYDKQMKSSIENRPIISFVSDRVYGKNEWHKVEVQTVAPENATFLKVGFQADNPATSFYLDDIEIQETIFKPNTGTIKHFDLPDEDFFNKSDSSFI